MSDAARWARVRALVEDLAERPLADRAAALDEACGGDGGLRAEVASLLAAHDAVTDTGSFLDDAAGIHAAALVAAVDPAPDGLPAGTRLGEYTIVRLVARGGMAAVYEATQHAPARTVALKVLENAGHGDPQRVRMFQREIESLARLRHPGIAQIHAAGTTPGGDPYFALEYVEGVPLDAYVRALPPLGDALERGLAQRLDLFAAVCEAVQYAHQRGVIHRDLKPANVMVTQEAGAPPRVKVLDFGIARLIEDDAGDRTHLTAAGAVLGTPAYMSPEQARGAVDEIDVRCDVYALGVLLYEMLTDDLPTPVRGVGLPHALRAIVETPPRRPSECVRALAGDLETIVLKALEKEPERRYASVAALADDIVRFRTQRPIEARPATAFYHLRKLASRHRAATVLTLALFVTLVGGIAATLTLWVKARHAAEAARRTSATAERVTTFLEGMYRVSDPSEERGNSVTAREVLDAGVAKIRTELHDEPEVRARLLATMGTVYRGLGLYREARPLLEQALATRRQVYGGIHLDVARSELALASLLRRLGEFDAARPHYESALRIRETLYGVSDTGVVTAIVGLANLEQETGDYDGARRLYQRGYDILSTASRLDSSEATGILFNYGLLLQQTGETPRAVELLQRCIRTRERLDGPRDVNLASDLALLGTAKLDLDDVDGAVRDLERARDLCLARLGPDHIDTAEALADLGLGYRRAKRYADAHAVEMRALERFRTILGPSHPTTAKVADNLAGILYDMGDERAALRYTEQAVAVLSAPPVRDSLGLGVTYANASAIAGACGEAAKAARYATLALRCLDEDSVVRTADGAQAQWTLARVAEASGREAEAARRFALIDAGATAPLVRSHLRRAGFFVAYAEFLRRHGRSAEASAVAARGR